MDDRKYYTDGINDDVLTTVSFAVDDFLAELTQRTNFDIVTLSAIVLARLTLACNSVGASEDFNKFLTKAIEKSAPGERVLQ